MKNFKKKLAGILAAVMTLVSCGFTALAAEGDIVTKYGTVPVAYADKAFAAFAGETFLGAYDEFYSGTSTTSGSIKGYGIFDAVKNYLLKNAVEAQILMLKDAPVSAESLNYVNMAQSPQKIVVDLNGKTLTQVGADPIFYAGAKPCSSYTPVVFETNVSMKNGNILLDDGFLITYDSWNGNRTDVDSAVKDMVLSFENIGFSFKDGYSKTKLVSYKGNSWQSPITATFDISYTSCNFDMSNLTNSITLCSTDHPETKNKINLDLDFNFTVAGGNIIGTDANGVKFYDFVDNNAKINLLPDPETGLYTNITLPSSASIPSAVTGDNITLNYGKYMEAEDGSIIYTPDIITEYGTVPAAYAGCNFAAFTDGNFLYAHDAFYRTGTATKISTDLGNISEQGIYEFIKNYMILSKKDAQIVMLRDSAMSSAVIGYGNLAQLKGNLVIDLCGRTLTQCSNDMIFNAAAKAWGTYGVFDTSITVKNGKILMDNGYLITYSSWDGKNDKTDSRPDQVKNMDFTFENIGFSFKDGYSKGALVSYNGANHMDPMAATFDINYTNCSFDMSNLTNNVALCATDHRATQNTMPNELDMKYKITGSKIIKNTADGLAITSFANGGSAEYIPGDDGLYITLTLPDTAAVPKVEVDVNGVGMIYIREAAEGGYTTYKLVPEADYEIKTAYGTVPAIYSEYSFAAFSEGEYLFSHDELFGTGNTGIYHMVKEYKKDNTVDEYGVPGEDCKEVQILQLKDAKTSDTYANLAQLKGSVVIDLGGKTLTTEKNKNLFAAAAKPWGARGVFDTEITMKNGRIVLNDATLMSYCAWRGSSYTGDLEKRMTFNFEDLDITLAENYTQKAIVAYTSQDNPMDATFDISFKNCDFDVRNASTRVTLFNGEHPQEMVSVNFSISGGSVIARDASLMDILKLQDARSTAALEKDSETGDYITLTLGENSSKPDELYDVNGETMRYERYAEDGSGNVIYKLSTPTEYEILDYDINKKESKVVVEEDGVYSVVFAEFDEDKLVKIDITEAELEKGVRTVSQDSDFIADEIMLWNNFKDMTPLCDSYKVIAATVIGNSFAVDSFTYLADIAAADGIDINAYNMYIGGRALSQHYDALSDESITYDVHKDGQTRHSYKTINDVLDMYDWDYVMLQGTTHNGQYDNAFWGKTYLTGEAVDSEYYWTGIKDAVAQKVPDAKRLVHATWATYESAAAKFNGNEFANGVPDARGAFTSGIVERAQLGANIYSTEKRADGEGEYIPTAVAVDYLIRHFGFPEYEGTLDSNKYSNLPDARGVYRDTTCHLTDNVGRVLAGLVWYEMITGTPATENNYTRDTLSDEDMSMLKEAAHYACENYMTYDPEKVEAA